MAMSPYMIGYAEIGRNIPKTPEGQVHPYQSWINIYQAQSFQTQAAKMKSTLNKQLITYPRNSASLEDVQRIFVKACMLEVALWEQSLLGDKAAKETIFSSFKALKAQKPLVLNLTNYVAMQSTANALLAIGASPIMAHSRHEMQSLMAISQGVLFNIGTLDQPFYERLLYAAEQANIHKKVVVLDPVGAGATSFRQEVCLALMQNSIAIFYVAMPAKS